MVTLGFQASAPLVLVETTRAPLRHFSHVLAPSGPKLKGTREAEEIYMNEKAKMQAATFKDKKKGIQAKNKGTDDPEYENINLTFRNQDQPKSGHSSFQSQVPAQSSPPSGPAQVPQWMYRAIMSLYILLALTFIFFIILSAVLLVKNSEMSQELKDLKTELQNATSLMLENERLSQHKLRQTVTSNIQTLSPKLDRLQAAVSNNIKENVSKLDSRLGTILAELAKKPNTREFGLEEKGERSL
ncbi:PREDICTED: mast cell-expressed membrane protein 1 [Elephantulus edwardii]|uniref:mast cell-expressed membrane protein 1 n=1 Tax=Elephantulus edwardii TaxID=28737 RepID=UPI0003F0F1AA|nr:PREDICTED: mast cell-expressed membrane protein 1 [Elephantulus edwardii]